jgi:hypothetical protein
VLNAAAVRENCSTHHAAMVPNAAAMSSTRSTL